MSEARCSLSAAKSALRRATNAATKQVCNERDNLLHTVLSSNPGSLFKAVRSSKSNSTPNTQSLKVGGKLYTGKSVSDGFYESLSSLKAPDCHPPLTSQQFPTIQPLERFVQQV